MATVQGTVISVSLETDVAKQSGGSYKGWELVYRTGDGRVQTIAKPVQGLRFNAALKQSLSELAAGDVFTLYQEKNAQGFNDVKSITKGADAAVPPPSAGASTTTSAPRAATNGGSNSYAARDFESKEERTLKQKLIVRQSSLSQAVSILSVGAKSSPKVEEIVSLAEHLSEWVYGGNARQQADQAVADIEDDIPY